MKQNMDSDIHPPLDDLSGFTMQLFPSEDEGISSPPDASSPHTDQLTSMEDIASSIRKNSTNIIDSFESKPHVHDEASNLEESFNQVTSEVGQKIISSTKDEHEEMKKVDKQTVTTIISKVPLELMEETGNQLYQPLDDVNNDWVSMQQQPQDFYLSQQRMQLTHHEHLVQQQMMMQGHMQPQGYTAQEYHSRPIVSGYGQRPTYTVYQGMAPPGQPFQYSQQYSSVDGVMTVPSSPTNQVQVRALGYKAEKEPKERKKRQTSEAADFSEEKPPEPYVELIAMAILSVKEKKMLISEIYSFLMRKYNCFTPENTRSWRNSVRHNLSLMVCFEKADRAPNGRGNYWRISRPFLQAFERGDFNVPGCKERKKSVARPPKKERENNVSKELCYVLPHMYPQDGRNCSSVPPSVKPMSNITVHIPQRSYSTPPYIDQHHEGLLTLAQPMMISPPQAMGTLAPHSMSMSLQGPLVQQTHPQSHPYSYLPYSVHNQMPQPPFPNMPLDTCSSYTSIDQTISNHPYPNYGPPVMDNQHRYADPCPPITSQYNQIQPYNHSTTTWTNDESEDFYKVLPGGIHPGGFTGGLLPGGPSAEILYYGLAGGALDGEIEDDDMSGAIQDGDGISKSDLSGGILEGDLSGGILESDLMEGDLSGGIDEGGEFNHSNISTNSGHS